MSPDYSEFIHKRLKKKQVAIRTIFPEAQWIFCYALLIIGLAGSFDPAGVLNRRCLERGFNPVLFSRTNILWLGRNNLQLNFPHNPPFRPPPKTDKVT